MYIQYVYIKHLDTLFGTFQVYNSKTTFVTINQLTIIDNAYNYMHILEIDYYIRIVYLYNKLIIYKTYGVLNS